MLPVLSYTSPVVARNVLRFRQRMLDAARARALELNVRGALFPWRTINGLESSAYYAASTAQYHIDADISFALCQYIAATGDQDFLNRGAIDILVETARMWADLGFWRGNGDDVFHIHGVTGPDEYTTVVNDNLYTNVMARANLAAAAAALRQLERNDAATYSQVVKRLDIDPDEPIEWARAAERMHIPFDEKLGIHPQDEAFLQKEIWDLDLTPESHRPLLLHYHPLVIYRFQVLKQADVVLALLLQGNEFTLEQKRADFEYYDPLTTGDSTLSAVVQSIIAAEVGYGGLATEYFQAALYVDLLDLHSNTADGIHVASHRRNLERARERIRWFPRPPRGVHLRPETAGRLGQPAVPADPARHAGARRPGQERHHVHDRAGRRRPADRARRTGVRLGRRSGHRSRSRTRARSWLACPPWITCADSAEPTVRCSRHPSLPSPSTSTRGRSWGSPTDSVVAERAFPASPTNIQES